jgi:hypothetical protein
MTRSPRLRKPKLPARAETCGGAEALPTVASTGVQVHLVPADWTASGSSKASLPPVSHCVPNGRGCSSDSLIFSTRTVAECGTGIAHPLRWAGMEAVMALVEIEDVGQRPAVGLPHAGG